MSTAELKINLIQKITQLNDLSLIEEMQRLLEFGLENGEFKLMPEQKSRILEAREEYKSANILSESKANKEIEEWLKK